MRRAALAAAVLALVAGAASSAAAARLPSGQPFTLAWGGDVTLGSSYGNPPDAARGLLAAVAPGAAVGGRRAP